MEGWVDLGYPAMHQPGVKLMIFRSSRVWGQNQWGLGAKPRWGLGAKPRWGLGAKPRWGLGAKPWWGLEAKPRSGLGAKPRSGLGAKPRWGLGAKRQWGLGSKPRWGLGAKPQQSNAQAVCSCETHFPSSIEHQLNNTVSRQSLLSLPHPTPKKLFKYSQIPRPTVAEVGWVHAQGEVGTYPLVTTGLQLWNNLLVELQQRDICLSEFRRILKTFLFCWDSVHRDLLKCATY